MEKLKMLDRIKELYMQNANIIDYLKKFNSNGSSSLEDIMISYEFQAGTYIKIYKEAPNAMQEYCLRLADVINGLGNFSSLLEVGVGEGTTLFPLLSNLNKQPEKCLGFDIAWSRIKYAKGFAGEFSINNVELFTGDLFCSPIKDNSVDIVYSSHSIEPNGGKEREALSELYRITNKYLLILEPSYEFASEKARKRMLQYGYVTNLYATVKELGYDIVEHKLFDTKSNPLNPTALMIIKKDGNSIENVEPLCCPITKTNLLKKGNVYYSKESLLAYPIIDDIPCLLPQNAIVATKFLD